MKSDHFEASCGALTAGDRGRVQIALQWSGAPEDGLAGAVIAIGSPRDHNEAEMSSST
jgi:hypothetical protein